MATEHLIRKMVDSGLRVNEDLAREIALRKDSVPYLVRILKEDEYWVKGGPGDSWAPFSATHILSAMKADEGLDAIIDVLKTHPEDYDDWLTEDIPSILANFGMKARAKLEKLLEDKKLDKYVRNAAFRAIAVLARENPDIMDYLFCQFRQMIKECDAEMVSLTVIDVAEFRDESMLRDIKSAFDKNMVDNLLVGWEDIDWIYKKPEKKLTYDRDKKDPMDHFKPENIRYLWKINYEDRKPPITRTDSEIKKKIGRNDPCPCGSGKKYKKCCLLKERGDTSVVKALQLKIRLDGIKPDIWRRFLVENSITFSQLHEIIQYVMGWDDYHLHEFEVDDICIEADDAEGFSVDSMWTAFRPKRITRPGSKTKLKEPLKIEKQKFHYLYDFGDSWGHTIVVEKILEKDSSKKYPACIAGERACPPEDCGGVWGYEEFLEAINDPKHPEHEEMLEWVGGEFDPEHFNIDEVNKSL